MYSLRQITLSIDCLGYTQKKN